MSTAIKKVSSVKTVKNEVKRQLLKSLEVKRILITGQISNAAVIGAAQFTSILPVIAQGTTDNTRVGNVVTTKKAMLRIVVSPAEDSAITWSTKRYRVMVLSLRNNQTVTATNAADLYDTGGAAIAGSGAAVDATYEINPDTFVVHHDQILYPKCLMDNGTVVPGYPLNDMSAFLQIDVTKFYKKRQIFEDATTSPTNGNLFLVVATIGASAYIAPAAVGVYDYSVYYDYYDA